MEARHAMFLAMILTNAKRVEARAVCMAVLPEGSRIDMQFADGSSRTLQAPPPDVLLKIVEALEQGERTFTSQIYSASVGRVSVQKDAASTVALVSQWEIEHT